MRLVRGLSTLFACLLVVGALALSAPTRALAWVAGPTGNTIDSLASQLNDLNTAVGQVGNIAAWARDYASWANTNADLARQAAQSASAKVDAAKVAIDAAKAFASSANDRAGWANANADQARQDAAAARASAESADSNSRSANYQASSANERAGWANSNADAARINAASARDAAVAAGQSIETARQSLQAAIDELSSQLASMSGGSGGSETAGIAGIQSTLDTVFGYAQTLPCRLRQAEGSGWWTSITSAGLTVYGEDADCGLRRGDLREIGREIAEASDPSEVEQLLRDLKGIAERQVTAAKEAAAAAAAAGDAVVREMQAERARDASTTAGWRGSGAGLPRLGGWTGGISCFAIRPPSSASMCGAGPAFDLGHGVIVRPLSYCGDMSVLTKWKPLVGALLIISAVWLAARWLLAALGVVAPTKE